jgi:hypothetical protein
VKSADNSLYVFNWSRGRKSHGRKHEGRRKRKKLFTTEDTEVAEKGKIINPALGFLCVLE